MSNATDTAGGVPRVLPTMPPRWVFSSFNPIARFLMAADVPLGFNGLITIRGRMSGLPRTTPVAIIEVSGRRWVWCPWGDVPWLRNLRAAGGASITVRRRQEEVRATELTRHTTRPASSESSPATTSSEMKTRSFPMATIRSSNCFNSGGTGS